MSGSNAATRALGLLMRYLAIPLSIVVLLLLWEFVASQTMDERGQFRITPASVWLGHAVGRMAEAEIRATTAAEAEKQRAVAEATARGQLTAQNDLQPQLQRQTEEIRVHYETLLREAQNRFDILKGGYDNLFQRASNIQEYANRMRLHVLQIQSQMTAQSQSGNSMMAMLFDIGCETGLTPNTCGQADRIRRGQMASIAQLGQGQLDMLQGFDDPARMMVRADQAARRAGTAPTPPPVQPAAATGLTYRQVAGQIPPNNTAFSVRLGSNGRAFFGNGAWASYQEERRGNETHFTFTFDADGNRVVRILRPQPNGPSLWLAVERMNERNYRPTLITSIENQQ